MFLGSYTPSFDILSRRVALPKKIRAYLAKDEIVLSYGFEKCLFGFDHSSWQKEMAKQLSLPLHEKRPRDIRRIVFATATVIKLDDQGRFVIPGNLQKYAKIRRPIIVGAGDHFEIWDENIWARQLKLLEKFSK